MVARDRSRLFRSQSPTPNGRTMPKCGKRWASSASLAGGHIVVLSHLRFAAGVCVLAAGLLIGSAWVASAVASADSSNSGARGDGRTNSSREGGNTASGPVGHVTHTQWRKFHRVTSTLGSGRQTGQQASPGAKGPKQEPGGTDTKDEKKDWSPVAAGSNVVAPMSDSTSVSDVAPAPDPTPTPRPLRHPRPRPTRHPRQTRHPRPRPLRHPRPRPTRHPRLTRHPRRVHPTPTPASAPASTSASDPTSTPAPAPTSSAPAPTPASAPASTSASDPAPAPAPASAPAPRPLRHLRPLRHPLRHPRPLRHRRLPRYRFLQWSLQFPECSRGGFRSCSPRFSVRSSR